MSSVEIENNTRANTCVMHETHSFTWKEIVCLWGNWELNLSTQKMDESGECWNFSVLRTIVSTIRMGWFVLSGRDSNSLKWNTNLPGCSGYNGNGRRVLSLYQFTNAGCVKNNNKISFSYPIHSVCRGHTLRQFSRFVCTNRIFRTISFALLTFGDAVGKKKYDTDINNNNSSNNATSQTATIDDTERKKYNRKLSLLKLAKNMSALCAQARCIVLSKSEIL